MRRHLLEDHFLDRRFARSVRPRRRIIRTEMQTEEGRRGRRDVETDGKREGREEDGGEGEWEIMEETCLLQIFQGL